MPSRGQGSTSERTRPIAVLVIGATLAGLGLGVVALTLGAEWRDPLVWMPDLVVGMAFFVGAALVWPSSRSAAVLALAVGVTWYLGSFVAVAHYWHRAPLIHLILLPALYRPGRWPRRLILTCAYVVSIVPFVWDDGVLALALSAAMVAIAWIPPVLRTRGPRAVLLSRWSLTILAVGVAGAVALTMLVPRHDGALAALILYEAALLAIAILQILARRSASTAVLTDLVVDLEESRSDALSGALGRALGDSTVRVGYWDSAKAEYRDTEDRLVELPDRTSAFASTEINRAGAPFAVVIHELSLQGDPRLLEAISSATTLTAANAELQASTRRHVADVEASRTRLVLAADAELRVLARQLDLSVAAPLRRLVDRIDGRTASGVPEADQTFAVSKGQILDVLAILDATTLGLPPGEIDQGLGIALAVLAARCPLRVTLDVTDERFAPEVESALYLSAAEAVTNSVKHSSARSVSIDVWATEDHVTLAVADDGSGRVDPASGTGITGIADRIAAMGGVLEVVGTPGSGTRVTARLPLHGMSNGS